jgi:UDP-N-acetylglucosamine--N-acetylmuramyl-(pentapeptide) pyrophosphoryl-undecaprenol N-acetylglucosamine transferase
MTESSKKIKVMLACGGTGGHLFPGVAIAEEMSKLRPDTDIVFAGTGRGFESTIIPRMGWPLVSIDSISIKDRKGLGRILAYCWLPVSILRSMSVIRREKPDMFIGVGGYAAGPLTLAAAFLKTPTAIIEPNAIAGFTNRMLGRFVNRIYTGFAEAGEFFPRQKVLLTGNPVRREILDLKQKSNGTKSPVTIFCFGGSQGALALNRAVVQSLPHLANLKGKIRFIHQVGEKENIEAIRKSYADNGFEADVFTFTDRIWECYERADLVISRAGATTVAEVAVLGLPSVFVPYPYAADDHQRANAESLVRREGAVMILQHELTGERLASEIKKITSERLASMCAAAARAGKRDAAKRIVEDCFGILGKKDV